MVLRADDLGYCEAINYGIEKSVRSGLIGSVGVMANMEAACHGVRLIDTYDLALGLHSNISAGRPVCEPSTVPSLVDTATGLFNTSTAYRTAMARGVDLVDAHEALCEVRAQLSRFRELAGRNPDYLDCHAVASPAFIEAVRLVAEEESLRHIAPFQQGKMHDAGNTDVRVCTMRSMDPDYDARDALKTEVLNAPEGSTSIYVCHPGYLDEYILTHSSLTRARPQEVDMLCDPDMRLWLAEHGVELIDYRDL